MIDGFDRRYAGIGVPAEPLVARRNDVLAEICRTIARNANYLDVVQECAVRLQRCFCAHSVAFVWLREGEMALGGIALPDHLDHLADEVRAQLARTPIDEQRPSVQAMRLRRIVRRDASDPSLAPATRELLRMGSADTLIAVPIYADGDPIGSCVVATREGKPLKAADEYLLEDALGIVGIVYQRGQQRERENDDQRHAIQAHHLAAVCELAAGVGHEINNPLSTIVHLAEILVRGDLPAGARDHAQAILDEALRAATTIRSLQRFAGQDSRPRRVCARVDEAVHEVAELEKHHLAAANVVLRVNIPPHLPAVLADEGPLRRILHSLVANARHAIHETRRCGEIVVGAERDGSWVRITVDDTGTGLSPQVEAAMFRPFFTTKGLHEGKGLGLAVAFGMVRDFAGKIEAENWGRPPALGGEPGEGGARLTVWLPADARRPEPHQPVLSPPSGASAPSVASAPSAPSVAPLASVPSEERASAARSLAILVAEDEPLVARAVAGLLKFDGHRVTLVATAEEAVEKLSAEGSEFDVVLSDYRMPGMGGEGLFDWVRSNRPAWLGRLVFMSGDLLSPRTQAFLDGGGRQVLAKPFTLEALRRALATLTR
jgi:signal transduction histidine kinase/CheY-like chemotaxis protein